MAGINSALSKSALARGATPGTYGRFTIRTQINTAPVLAMVRTFEKNTKRVDELAARYIKIIMRDEVFTTFIARMAANAGPEWPEIYTDHLIAAMTQVPIYVASSGTAAHPSLEVSIDLGVLGDFKDLERGAHYKALLATGGEENHPPPSGARNHGKSGVHHGYNPHPARVQLPYNGEPLMNEKEARQEFWERVVVDRDFSFELLLRRGKENWVLEDHMQRMGYDVATLDEVYMARTLAWGSKAPQWLLLENGSRAIFGESAPRTRSVDFTRTLTVVANCISSKVYEGAVETLVRLAEEAGVRQNVIGQPINPLTGQYVEYKELLTIDIKDYGSCFGRV